MARYVLSLSVIILAAGVGASSATIIGGPAVNPANGHIYYVVDPNTWTGAQAEAESLGGDLVTINDADEGDWLGTEILSGMGLSGWFWIGFNDADTEGSFVWASGEDPGYTDWMSGQPINDNGDEDYAAMLLAITVLPIEDHWAVFPNTGDPSVPVFGEFGGGVVEVVPEPASLSLLAFGGLALLRRR